MHIKATLSFMLCCLALADSMAQDAASEIRCGFDGGIPSSFTLIDADGNTPSSDLGKYGFSVGTPWVAYYVEKEQNFVAASTSWYEQNGTSSDWLILPPITIKDAEAIVSWRAKATDSRYSDGYAVYVTTGEGQSVADFDTTAPLFSTKAEAPTWTRHSINLAQYVGQTVRIAFVNNSTDCSVLNANNVQVVTMIIDTRDNTIVNADRVNLIDTPMSLGGIRANRCHQKERFYTIDGRAATSDRRGLLIVRNADGTVRKMVR